MKFTIRGTLPNLNDYITAERKNRYQAAAWNILFALYMEIKHPELQDIPTRISNPCDVCPNNHPFPPHIAEQIQSYYCKGCENNPNRLEGQQK